MTVPNDYFETPPSEPSLPKPQPTISTPVAQPAHEPTQRYVSIGDESVIAARPEVVNSAEIKQATLRPVVDNKTITPPTPPSRPVSLSPPVTQPESPEQYQRGQPGSLIAREIIETFLLTLLIFWAVNTITGRFRIEGSSMMPTMQEGEYVLINKLAYYLEEPKRGDIIVLHYPRDPSRDFIKRVVGIPGDLVEIDDGEVEINGQLISEPYINSAPQYNGSWTVPDDQFFVLGDNRNNSSDSHTWGFLPRDHIVGKGWVVYWPVDQVERIPHYEHPLANTKNPFIQQPALAADP